MSNYIDGIIPDRLIVMDTKYSCPKMFKREISRFLNGQIQFRTVYGEVFRGKPLSIRFDEHIHPRRFFIWFEWYVAVRPVLVSSNGLPFLCGDRDRIHRSYTISFDLEKFYFPKSYFAKVRRGKTVYVKRPDRRRMKWTTSANDEEFRFFLGDDHARLEFNGDGDLVSMSPVTLEEHNKGVPTPIQRP